VPKLQEQEPMRWPMPQLPSCDAWSLSWLVRQESMQPGPTLLLR